MGEGQRRRHEALGLLHYGVERIDRASKEERIEGWRPTIDKPNMPRRANEIPQNIPDHMKLMLDLTVLAFQMDKTRITLMLNNAQSVPAVMGFTIMLWASRAINNGIASVLMMALLIVAGIRPAVALSGFSSPAFWVLLTVLFYGFAIYLANPRARAALTSLECGACRDWTR